MTPRRECPFPFSFCTRSSSMLALSILWIASGASAVSEPTGPSYPNRPLYEAVRNFLNDVTGAEEFQKIIDSAGFRTEDLDPANLVQKMESSLSEKFRTARGTVENQQKAVKRAYESNQWTYDMTECCILEGDDSWTPTFDQRFGTTVDLHSACTRISADSPTHARVFPGSRSSPTTLISSAMESLQMMPGIKYQYYGDENGMFTQYPSTSTGADCGSYDSRFRPWYVVAATPRPKDVVLCIDRSGSMLLENRMEEAKEAVATVLETLSPNDRVAVVAFSSDMMTPPGREDCYSDQLAVASPQNIRFLLDWVKSLYPMGGTHYINPLEKAFDYFVEDERDGNSDSSRDRAILFMSDGEPSDSTYDLFGMIRNKNDQLNNRAVIMTYGFGDGIDWGILQRMAEQDGSQYGSPKSPSAPTGVFEAIAQTDNLRTRMGSYYNFFKDNEEGDLVQWSVPYYDAIGGSGLVITASAAVVVEGELKGVVGADVSMRELLAEVTYFRQDSEKAYSFILDRQFRAIAHPFLPAPSSVENDPVIVNITMLERSPALKEGILPTIMRYQRWSDRIGNETVMFQMPSVWVKEEEHGLVFSDHKNVKISCRLVRDSPFTACVVVDQERHEELHLAQQDLPGEFEFKYHRYDIDPPREPCIHLNRTSRLGSAVKLSLKAFEEMDRYLELNETLDNITCYERQIVGRDYHGDCLRILPNAIDDIRLTFKLEDLWRDGNSLSGVRVLWKYIGTQSGVFRIFPGVRLAHEYDPTMRPWYRTAMAHRDDSVITAPYVDAFSRRWIMTLARAVSIYRDGDPTSHPYAVIASDVLLSDFRGMLFNMEPQCRNQECILIDKSCHVIFHDDFVDHTMDDTIGQHLATIDSGLAGSLYMHRIMIREDCVDVSNIRTKHYCRVNTDQIQSIAPTTYDAEGFHVKIVQESNAILIRKTQYVQGDCLWHDSQDDSPKCSHGSGEECETPCEYPAPFDYCSNYYEYDLYDDPPPCAAAKPKGNILPRVIDETASDLPTCIGDFQLWDIHNDDDFVSVHYPPPITARKSIIATTLSCAAVGVVLISVILYRLNKKKRRPSSVQPQDRDPTYQTERFGGASHIPSPQMHERQTQVHGTTTQIQGVSTQMYGVPTQMHGVPTQMHGFSTQMQGAPTYTPGVLPQMTGVLPQIPGVLPHIQGVVPQAHVPASPPPAYGDATGFPTGIPPPATYIPPASPANHPGFAPAPPTNELYGPTYHP